MKRTLADLPGWVFVSDEVSANVYEVIGHDGKGRQVSARGTALREVVKAAAGSTRDLDGRSAADVYRHQAGPDVPIGEHVLDRIELPDGSSIILLDWMAERSKDGRNLVRMDAEGEVRWTFDLSLTSAVSLSTACVRVRRKGALRPHRYDLW